MKKILFIYTLFSLVILCAQAAPCQSIDELSEQFDQEYEAVKPPSASSSVGTDYIFQQTALSTRHTVRILELMHGQNQEILSKYDEIIQKYDEIIRQNNEIIKILSELGKKEEKEE